MNNRRKWGSWRKKHDSRPNVWPRASYLSLKLSSSVKWGDNFCLVGMSDEELRGVTICAKHGELFHIANAWLCRTTIISLPRGTWWRSCMLSCHSWYLCFCLAWRRGKQLGLGVGVRGWEEANLDLWMRPPPPANYKPAVRPFHITPYTEMYSRCTKGLNT